MINFPGGFQLDLETATSVADFGIAWPRRWQLFEATLDGPHDELRPVDILSLAAAVDGLTVEQLHDIWDEVSQLQLGLAGVPKIAPDRLPELAAEDLAEHLARVAGLLDQTRTVALIDKELPSLLVYRLRPHAAPIIDEEVLRWYDPFWLDDPGLVRAIFIDVRKNADALRRLVADTGYPTMSLVRAWCTLLSRWTVDRAEKVTEIRKLVGWPGPKGGAASA